MTSLLEDGVFWSGVAVLVISGYKFTVSYCLKSRCERFDCLWGLLKIKRDIKSEVEIEKIQSDGIRQDDIDLEIGEDSIDMSTPSPSPVTRNTIARTTTNESD